MRRRGVKYWWAGLGLLVLSFSYGAPIAAAFRNAAIPRHTATLPALAVPRMSFPLLRVPKVHAQAPLPPLARPQSGSQAASKPVARKVVRQRVPVVSDVTHRVPQAPSPSVLGQPKDPFANVPVVVDTVGLPVALPSEASTAPPAVPATPATTDTAPADAAAPAAADAAAPADAAAAVDALTPDGAISAVAVEAVPGQQPARPAPTPVRGLALAGDTGSDGSTDPAATTDTGTTDTGTTDTGTTDTGTTDPAATDTGTTDPAATDSGTIDPPATDSGTIDPAATDLGTTTTTETVTIVDTTTGGTGTVDSSQISSDQPTADTTTTSGTEATGGGISADPSQQSAGGTDGMSTTGSGSSSDGGAAAGDTTAIDQTDTTATATGTDATSGEEAAASADSRAPPALWEVTLSDASGHIASISSDGSSVVVVVDGVSQARPLVDITGLHLVGGAGNDDIGVDASVLAAGVSVLVDGGAGTDTLRGAAVNTTWSVAGPGSGSFASVSFAGFENLTGAADNEDTFVFEAGGSLSGVADGGARRLRHARRRRRLVFERLGFTTTGPNSGTVSRDADMITYAGLEPIADNVTTDHAATPFRQRAGPRRSRSPTPATPTDGSVPDRVELGRGRAVHRHGRARSPR